MDHLKINWQSSKIDSDLIKQHNLSSTAPSLLLLGNFESKGNNPRQKPWIIALT